MVLLKRPPSIPRAAALTLLAVLAACSPSAVATQVPPAAQIATPETQMTSNPNDLPESTAAPAVPIATPEPVAIDLANPSFEEGHTGWISAGSGEALLESGGHESETRLTHQGEGEFRLETTLALSGLSDGWVTLRGWARSSGGQDEVFAALACGAEERRVHIPSTLPGYRWINFVVSLEVTGGSCTIRLVTDGNAGSWTSFDDFTLLTGRSALSILGADISSLSKSEDFGGMYRDPDGTAGDALAIMKSHGLNYARLRVFFDPADGYHNKDKLLEMAVRLKEQGIGLLVDFHYSDNWADPGKQNKPAAWEDLDFEALKQALYDHTYDVCSALVQQGTPPQMVQVGNEINAGMLWPDAMYDQMDNLADLLKTGYQAVKDCSPDTLVMLHIAEGGDNELAKWWFGNITGRDVPFDLIGISYYPFWHGTLAELQFNLNDISTRYEKDVVVVETAYGFTTENGDFLANIFGPDMETPGYPISPAGQAAFMRDVMAVVRAVPNGRGLGVFYWDATWTAVEGNGWDNMDPSSGNAWENQALFDYEGIILPAFDAYLFP
ncbi:MAG TPA: arabinogalactan endo-1,4-beta-galactosidase [Anaerolineales bacterium]|nr:arabinogalactan endo-1,4-beta-galactosidase [Anaerolineales bacterium]